MIGSNLPSGLIATCRTADLLFGCWSLATTREQGRDAGTVYETPRSNETEEMSHTKIWPSWFPQATSRSSKSTQKRMYQMSQNSMQKSSSSVTFPSCCLIVMKWKEKTFFKSDKERKKKRKIPRILCLGHQVSTTWSNCLWTWRKWDPHSISHSQHSSCGPRRWRTKGSEQRLSGRAWFLATLDTCPTLRKPSKFVKFFQST